MFESLQRQISVIQKLSKTLFPSVNNTYQELKNDFFSWACQWFLGEFQNSLIHEVKFFLSLVSF